jgi:Flp pilus assembly pilin Flp
MLRRLVKNRKGQGLVEYGLLIAGVALMCAASVSVFGSKTQQLIGALTAVLPGAHSADNSPLLNSRLIETAPAPGTTAIGLDLPTIVAHSDGNTDRLLGACCGFSVATGSGGFAGLLVQPVNN